MTNRTSNGAPPTRTLVFVLVFVGLGLAAMLVLYALTPAPDRPALLNRLGTVVPTLIVGVPAVLAWLNGKQAAANSAALETKVDQVAEHVDQVGEHVNGRMSQLLDKVPDAPRGDVP